MKFLSIVAVSTVLFVSPAVAQDVGSYTTEKLSKAYSGKPILLTPSGPSLNAPYGATRISIPRSQWTPAPLVIGLGHAPPIEWRVVKRLSPHRDSRYVYPDRSIGW